MPLTPGALVVVRTLANRRGEVLAADGRGRYQVRVGSATMWCDEKDLTPSARTSERKAARGQEPRAPAATAGEAARPGRVDLHGLPVGEGIARVVDEIDRALRRGADRVEVLHGKGSGRMKAAVHRQLAGMPVVASFKVDQRNDGVTWVFF